MIKYIKTPYGATLNVKGKSEEDILTFDGTMSELLDSLAAQDESTLKARLRAKRRKECFIVVNRGQLWYDTLTEAQKTELKEWYTAWLNVTESGVVPDKPSWLEEA